MSLFASNPNFRPTEVVRFIKGFGTGVGTLLVETDTGPGYLKALGNPDGPHALAKDFLGTHLAAAIGLPTFDYALLEVTEIDELPFFRGGMAAPGPAFVTRAEPGTTWGKDRRLLKKVGNPQDIAGLVVVDTWLTNTDRHAPAGSRVNLDNVFFSSETPGSAVSLRAMDFSHAIKYGGELTTRVSDIATIKDEQVYGLFPEFRDFLSRDSIRCFADRLAAVTRQQLDEAIRLIPRQWEVDAPVRRALEEFLFQRAVFVSANIEQKLFSPPQQTFAPGPGGVW